MEKQFGAHAAKLSWVPAAADGPGGSLDFALFGLSPPSLWDTRPQGRKDLQKERAKTRQQFQETAPEPRGAGSGGWRGQRQVEGATARAGAAGSAPRPLSALGPCRGTAAVTPLSGTQPPEFTAPSPKSEKMDLTSAPPWLHFGESSLSC